MAKVTLDNYDQVIKLAEVKTLAEKLIRQHGLTDWSVEFDRTKVRGGRCHYPSHTIGLSAYLMAVWEWDHIRNVILHEIAHALLPGHGHDLIWKAKFLSIGGNGKIHWGSDGETQLGKYVGECPNGHKVYKQRRSKIMTERRSCSRCSSRFDARYIITWRENDS